MKVLLTLDGGFSKEIFNGDKAQVKAFLEGYKEIMPLVNTSTSKEDLAKKLLSVIVMAGDVAWMLGAIARLDNSVGKLEVVE